METVDLLGLKFDNLDALDVVRALLARHRGARFGYVVTPNADHLARLRRQPALRTVYEAAWLRVLDSQALRRVALRLGLPTPHVATGADITASLLSALGPQTVAVIGLDPAHMPALRARYPDISFAHHAPPQDLLFNQVAFRRARDFAVRTNARFTFIALGSPLQELLAYAISLQPGVGGVGLCIGSALEYCAGARRRAPGWMRRFGLEWLHRLARQPVRLAPRYLRDDPPVFAALAAAAIKRKFGRSPPDQPARLSAAAISGRDPYPQPRLVPLHEIRDAG